LPFEHIYSSPKGITICTVTAYTSTIVSYAVKC
jgi:hypothetical protein